LVDPGGTQEVSAAVVIAAGEVVWYGEQEEGVAAAAGFSKPAKCEGLRCVYGVCVPVKEDVLE